MTTITTVEMFYIGNFADMDTDESDFDNENPNVVLGTHDDLVITDVTEVDVNDDGVINDDELGTGDYLSYDTGGGVTNVNLDSSSLYNADILLGDGSTLSVRVLVIQAANGDVFISEFPAEPLDGLSIQSISLISLDTSDAGGINAGASDVQNASVVCYAAGTMIDTPDGPRAVEELTRGDLVITLDHGPQPIRWTRSADYSLDDTEVDAKPVQIKAGALGHNLPAQDLIVSPQHRILVGAAGQLHLVFASEAFVSAKSLTALADIRHMNGKKEITWIHFACDRHEIVTANGCLSESLLLGPMVLKSLSSSERHALTDIFGLALNSSPRRECLTVGATKRKITTYLKSKNRLIGNEIRRWDRDLAMEKYDAKRMKNAQSMTPSREAVSRVA